MLKKVLLGVLGFILVAVIGLVGTAAATQPSEFRIQRSMQMATSADKIFAVLIDFHQWSAWSPWDKLDPDMKKVYGGPATGVGATYAWTGNDEVGEGKMTLVEARPNELVGMKLEFIKPFEATNGVELRLAPAGAGTEVTWVMTGTNDLMGKVFSLCMDMDAMVGKDFETGLGNLKRLVGG